MSKLLKISSAILALIMVVSLFAACGNKTETDVDDNDKKIEDKVEKEEEEETEPVLTAEDVLVGKWNAETIIEDVAFVLNVTFEADGSAKMEYPEESYNKYVDTLVENILKEQGVNDFNDEQKAAYAAALGVTTFAEVKEYFVNMMAGEMPYEELAAEFDLTGTWELDGDKLTLTLDEDVIVSETALSKGEETFTMILEEQELTFTKK